MWSSRRGVPEVKRVATSYKSSGKINDLSYTTKNTHMRRWISTFHTAILPSTDRLASSPALRIFMHTSDEFRRCWDRSRFASYQNSRNPASNSYIRYCLQSLSQLTLELIKKILNSSILIPWSDHGNRVSGTVRSTTITSFSCHLNLAVPYSPHSQTV